MGDGLILASASAARRHLLARAGLAFEVEAAQVDEDSIKKGASGLSTADLALALAAAKAAPVSHAHPGALVIGADQMLECEGRRYDKPKSLAEARAHLLSLRGRTHELVSAAVLMKGGAAIWRGVDKARLKMRSFSEDFLEDYLDRMGDETLRSVGCYRIESLGIQLFESVEGEHSVVLGLPLLGLLEALRREGAVPS